MGEETEHYITSVIILDEKIFPLKTRLSFVPMTYASPPFPL